MPFASTNMLAGLLIAFGIAAYWPACAALWRYWIDEPSLGGHGLLIAPLAVWLVFRARDRVDCKSVHPSLWALLLLVPCTIAALTFWKSGIQALQLLMLPVVIWLAILAGLGTSVARTLAVPIGYLYFAMPAWNLLSAPLQELTASVVGLAAPAVGLPASVSGTSIAFPNGARFIVTLACSGVGFLTQGLAIAVLLGELEEAKFARRLGLFVSMALVALATNWIRVLMLLAIGYFGGMDNPIVSKYHLEFGYVLFVIVLVTFVWAVTRSAMPDPNFRTPSPRLPLASGFPAAVVGLIGAPLLVALWSYPIDVDPAVANLSMPAGNSAWRGPMPAGNDGWDPVFVGAHSEQQVTYRNHGGQTVQALSISYAVQRQGRELVNEGNSLLGTGGLALVAASLVDVDGSTYREDVAVDDSGNRSVIWSFYDIEGESFVVPVLSQLTYGMRALTSRPTADLFAFRTACIRTCDEARDVLTDFLQNFSPDARGSERQSARTLNRKSGAAKRMNEIGDSQEPTRRPGPLSSFGNSFGVQL